MQASQVPCKEHCLQMQNPAKHAAPSSMHQTWLQAMGTGASRRRSALRQGSSQLVATLFLSPNALSVNQAREQQAQSLSEALAKQRSSDQIGKGQILCQRSRQLEVAAWGANKHWEPHLCQWTQSSNVRQHCRMKGKQHRAQQKPMRSQTSIACHRQLSQPLR